MRGAVSRASAGCRAVRVLLPAICILLAALVSVALPGCKYSDVLTQHTEDPDLGMVDESVEPLYRSNPEAEKRPDLDDVSIAASDDQNTQVALLPHYDPNADDNGPTLRRVKSDQTPHDEKASEGDLREGEPDREGRGDSDQGGQDASSGTGDLDSDMPNDEEREDEPDPEDPLDEEQSDEEALPDDGGGSGETVVVNPDGTEDETEKGTVAAVGEYATIAQMLGGAGALAAADEAWLSDRAADGAFSGELDYVADAFAGDGSKAGSCDVEKLIEAAPAVVLWDSAGNIPALGEGERAEIEEAGIVVQAVPHIGEKGTEDYEVKMAMAEVASVLEGASGLSYVPAEVLSQYNAFHDEVLRGCYSANGGYSYKVADRQFIQLYQDTPLSGLVNSTTTRVITAYVDDLWHPGASRATVDQKASVATGMVALANDGKSLDVSDGVALSAKTSTADYMLIDYYLQLAGAMNNAYDTAAPESQGRAYILMPGSTAAFGMSGNFASRSSGTALFFNAGDGSVAGNWHALGDGDFNTLLVSSPEIAEAIVASAAKADGLYRMEGSYAVVVVPSGIGGAWSEGHIDSFLMCPWAFRLQDAASLKSAESYVEGFYSKFLRCSSWKEAVSNWDNATVAAGSGSSGPRSGAPGSPSAGSGSSGKPDDGPSGSSSAGSSSPGSSSSGSAAGPSGSASADGPGSSGAGGSSSAGSAGASAGAGPSGAGGSPGSAPSDGSSSTSASDEPGGSDPDPAGDSTGTSSASAGGSPSSSSSA